MRILVISNLYPPNAFGGYEVLAEVLVEQFRQTHEVRVLTSTFEGEFPSHVLPLLMIAPPFPLPYAVSGRQQLKVAQVNAGITKRVVEEFRPDVILVSDVKRLTLTPLLTAQRLCPTVTFINDIPSFGFACAREGVVGRALSLFDRMAGRCLDITLDYVVSSSRNCLDGQSPRLRMRKTSVVGVGIRKPSEFDRLLAETPRDPEKLVHVGRLEPDKGAPDIIEALSILVHEHGRSGLSLDIAGFTHREDFLQELRDLAVARGVGSKVRILGRVSEEMKYRLLASGAAFVFASTFPEGHGQTYLEAMLCSTPCVCTAPGGAKEALRDSENCVLFEGGNPRSLASALEKLFSDDSLRSTIAANGKAMVESRYLAEHVAQRCEAALLDCAGMR